MFHLLCRDDPPYCHACNNYCHVKHVLLDCILRICNPINVCAFLGTSYQCLDTRLDFSKPFESNAHFFMAIAFDHCCFDREIPLPRDPDEDPTNCDLFAMALAYGNAWGCFGAAGFRRDIRKSAKRGSCLGSSASAGASARGMRGAEHEEKHNHAL